MRMVRWCSLNFEIFVRLNVIFHLVEAYLPSTARMFIGVLDLRIISDFFMVMFNFNLMPVLIIVEENIRRLEKGRCCNISSTDTSHNGNSKSYA